MKAFFRRFVFAAIALICFVSITIFSGNKYEWMLDEDPNSTLPVDPDALVVSFFALMPIFLLLFCFIFVKKKSEKIFIALSSIVLLGYWLYRCRFILFQ